MAMTKAEAEKIRSDIKGEMENHNKEMNELLDQFVNSVKDTEASKKEATAESTDN